MDRARTAHTASWWADMPLFLLAAGVGAVSMIVPAAHAVIVEDFATARAFFYSGLLGTIICTMIGIAHAGQPPRHGTLGPLFSLFSVMVFLPALLAVPFYEALRTTTFFNAYVELVAAITTTGTVIFDAPERLSSSLHLWLALVAWMGGFVMWSAAAAILAPLNLGGFEVTTRAEPGRQDVSTSRLGKRDVRLRLLRVAGTLFPIYSGLTLALWILLIVVGETPLAALCHAMSTLSTSGISPVGGVEYGASGIAGEMLIFLFLIFAVSRLTFSKDTINTSDRGILQDPELQLGAAILISIPVILVLRHWIGAFEVEQAETVEQFFRALWGSVFTVLGFLTTTGFASSEWGTSQAWSGLATPGLILVGLALIGGGVATTAGGVKLLRVFALYRHGVREMEKLVHPSSVTGARAYGRRLQRFGAFIAWIFFMLFAMTLAGLSFGLASVGVQFEDAIVLSSAALANTGPLLHAALPDPIGLATLPTTAKVIFVTGMVIGRLETLAIIALLTPSLWRA